MHFSKTTFICFISLILVAYVRCDLKFNINRDCDERRGEECVEIRECRYFVDLLDSTRIPRPRHIIKIIRERQCGFVGNVPKVCCDLPETNDAAAAIGNQIHPRLKQHRNVKLLPIKGCGGIANTLRITGGSRSTLMEFPWMALLAYNTSDGFDFRCGGTVINERYILTAAHCVRNTMKSTLVGVRLGEHNVNTRVDCEETLCAPPVQDFYVQEVIVHSEYMEDTFSNDIALIRLASVANFTYVNVKPVCLPLQENDDLDGRFGVISGWGLTETGFRSAELLKASIPITPHHLCTQIYQSNNKPITERQFCAGGGQGGRDSCGGDSGGPLQSISLINGTPKYVQYGIVSYGPRECGTEGQPGVYTKVYAYLDWIMDHIYD